MHTVNPLRRRGALLALFLVLALLIAPLAAAPLRAMIS